MVARKKIGLLLMFPENIYQQRIMSGIFSQCEKYDYDVIVFAPQAQITNYYKDYLQGELNIFEYVNFDLLDGVIVAPLTMNEDRITTVCDLILKKLKNECTKPVVSLDYEFGDYPVAYTDDRTAFYYITRHCIRTHKCRKIMMLAGPKDYPVSTARIDGVRDAMREEGMKLDDDMIRYGDFWYSGGEQLGSELATKPDDLPQAVICASDHMAIGLTNYLIKAGIKVPEQVIVTGYEATEDAMVNVPSITSYSADEVRTGALAVNMLHKRIDPDEPNIELQTAGTKNLCIGGSCGCNDDFRFVRSHNSGNILRLGADYAMPGMWSRVDINMLLESYITEILTATNTPLECLGKIYESTYLLKPYGVFYLCLNEDWLNTECDIHEGYSDRMRMILYSDMAKKLHGYYNHIFCEKGRNMLYDRKQMLPELPNSMLDQPAVPQVYYIVPVHFNTVSLGVAILQNNLNSPGLIGNVFRNYIRNINNALEMIRNRDRITQLSEHDSMTGLLNRRGMNSAIEKMKERLANHPGEFKNPGWAVYVADLDGLKKINDTYGHNCGDTAIITIAEAMKKITEDNEICVRSGGDEFVIIGLGDYDENGLQERVDRFNEYIAGSSPYNDRGDRYNASIDYKYAKCGTKDITEVLNEADAKMYDCKRTRSDARGR